MRRVFQLSVGVVIVVMTVSGCASEPRRVATAFDEAAKAKVKALEVLAEEMAKDPEGSGAQAALEQFRVMELDATKNPEQAQQLVEVYRQRIEGKYQGAVAQEIRGSMAPYLKKD